MAAPNKQQALAQKKRTTDYGAEPGEVTKGLKPGDRYYDPDTNTWQIGPQAKNARGDLNGYLDQIMGVSGMTDVQGSTSGNTGTGSSGSGKSSEASEGGAEASASADQDSEGNWIIPAAIAAMGAGAIAAWMAARKSGKGKGATATSTASNPATDTAGAADTGGPSEGRDVMSRPRTDVMDLSGGVDDDIIDAIYTMEPDRPQVGGPRAALPAPDVDVADAVMAQGTQPMQSGEPSADRLLAEPRDADVQAWIDGINENLRQSSLAGYDDPVSQSMQAVEGPNAPMVDPNLELALQQFAQQSQGARQADPFFMDRLRGSEFGDMPMYIQQRLRAIMSGM